MNRLIILYVAIAMVLGMSQFNTATWAQDDGTIPPMFDPFTREADSDAQDATVGKKPSRASARISDDNEPVDEDTGFKWLTLPKPKLPALPKLSLPTWTTTKETPRERMRQTQEPSTWDKVSGGTKSLFTKTKQTLMPWAQDDEPSTTRKPNLSSRRPPQRTASRTKGRQVSAEKKSIFSWFSKEEPQDDPFENGVNGFLAQPRPR